MDVDEKVVSGLLTVTPAGPRLDAAYANTCRGRMVDRINAGHHYIIIDLSSVEFMDSSGLNALLSILNALSGEGELVLCGLQKPVASIFRLTKLDRVFSIYDDQEKAIGALSAKTQGQS